MSEIVFQVEKDLVDGGWVATALGHGITTQANNLDELKDMIRDALKCHFDLEEDIPSVIRLMPGSNEAAILAESALAQEWLSLEEDAAWAHLRSHD